MNGPALLPHRDREIRHAFRLLVTHSLFIEKRDTGLRSFFSFFSEGEFEVDFRKIKVAKREMVVISTRAACLASSPQSIDSSAVLAAKIVEPRDVVVRLAYQQRHAMCGRKLACFFIDGHGTTKFIQADEAHSHVVQRDCD